MKIFFLSIPEINNFPLNLPKKNFYLSYEEEEEGLRRNKKEKKKLEKGEEEARR